MYDGVMKYLLQQARFGAVRFIEQNEGSDSWREEDMGFQAEIARGEYGNQKESWSTKNRREAVAGKKALDEMSPDARAGLGKALTITHASAALLGLATAIGVPWLWRKAKAG